MYLGSSLFLGFESLWMAQNLILRYCSQQKSKGSLGCSRCGLKARSLKKCSIDFFSKVHNGHTCALPCIGNDTPVNVKQLMKNMIRKEISACNLKCSIDHSSIDFTAFTKQWICISD